MIAQAVSYAPVLLMQRYAPPADLTQPRSELSEVAKSDNTNKSFAALSPLLLVVLAMNGFEGGLNSI